MPLEVQPKLLRALQDGEVERVGSTAPRRVDVRILAATNVDLARAVAKKQFREDLFFRLNVLPIRLPPLRERPEDLPALVESFLAEANQKLGRSLSGTTPALLAALKAQSFPGNVRELWNLIERMAILADGAVLDMGDLPPEYQGGRAPEAAAGAANAAAGAAAGPAPSLPPPSGGLKAEVRAAVQSVERNAILRALEATGWNVTRSAERLGLSRK
jgi:transcriptional regulator with GAF, ATPase, and Fis domain